MNKSIRVLFVLVLAFMTIFAMSSCVDPINVVRTQEIEGLPDSSNMYSYGLHGLEFPVELMKNTKHTIEQNEQGIRITFTGDSATEEAILELFSLWTLEDESENRGVRTLSYSRGITWVEFTINPPNYSISFYKEPGVKGWPENSKLAEYFASGFAQPSVLNQDDISHIIELTHSKSTEGVTARGFLLSLRIYNTFSSVKNDLKQFFDSNTNWQAITDNGTTLENLRSILGDDEILELLGKELGLDQDNPDWSIDLPDGIFDNLSIYRYGESVFAYLHSKHDPHFYEIDISKQLEGEAGWPEKDILNKYGLFRLALPANVANAIESNSTYEEKEYDPETTEYDEFYIRFYDDTNNPAEKVLSDYFSSSTWTKQTSDNDNVRSYSRGIAYVDFNSTYKPYYEIGVYKNPNTKKGWPSADKFKEYGFYGFTNQEDAGRVYHLEEDGQLYIWFFGSTDKIKTYISNSGGGYFHNWNIDQPGTDDDPSPSIKRYSRGPSSVVYAEDTYPFYELVLGTDGSYEKGWPESKLKTYGLHNLTSLGTNNEFVYMYNEDAKDNILSISFYHDTANSNGQIGTHLDTYFTTNNWKEIKDGDIDENGNRIDVPAGTRAFTRGVAYVSYNHSQSPNYYEIDVSRDVDSTPGWPTGTDLLREYGLQGFIGQPSGIENDDNLSYKKGQHINEKDVTVNDLIIGFYVTNDTTAKTAIKNYFDSNWKYEADFSDEDAGKYVYTRGLSSATFDTSAYPYYEIEVNKEPGEYGWPTTNILNKHGLHGFLSDAPSGINQDGYSLYYVEEEDQTNPTRDFSLTIGFYSDTTVAMSAINFAFDTSWTQEIVSNVYSYSRGYTYVEFDTSRYPFYELTAYFSLEGDNWTTTSPSNDTLRDYHLYNSSNASRITLPTADYSYVTYEKTQEDNSESDTLTIRYYATAISDQNNVKTWLTTYGWKESDTDEGHYSYGSYSAFLNSTQSPFFELSVELDEGVIGWPSDNTRNKFRIGRLNQPTGVTTTYSEEEDDLTIWFYGGTATSITTFFNNYWLSETSATTGVYEYRRGSLHATFDPRTLPYTLEISIDSTASGYEGLWPTNAEWTKYGMNPITKPSSTNDYGYMIDADNLVVWFEASTANYLSSIFGSSNGWTPTDTGYTRGPVDVTATYNSTSSLFYELEIEIEAGTHLGEWPSVTLWSNYGLGNITLPSNTITSYGYMIDDDGSLVVWFETPSGGNSTTIGNTFKGNFSTTNGWTVSGTEYSKGPVYVTDNSTGAYFEFAFELDSEAETGVWPTNADLWKKYGMDPISQPSNTTALGYKIEGNDLVIWFEAPSGSTTNAITTIRNNIGNNFALSNGWTTETDGYSRDPVSVTITTTGICFELEVSIDAYNSGLPSLTSFGLQGLESILTSNGAMLIGYEQSGNEYEIFFVIYPSSTTTTARNAIDSYITSVGGEVYSTSGNTTSYYNGVFFLVLTNSGPYFTIEVMPDTL